MSFSATLAEPFYTGAGASSEVPDKFPLAVAGRTYMLDEIKPAPRESIPGLRAQADTGAEPAERSLNPADLWRRFQETWHKGAGQKVLDRADSDRARFRSSEGVDPWTQFEMGLLNDTQQKLSSANANLRGIAVGTYLYAIDGGNVKFTADPTPASPSFTTVTGGSGNSPSSVTTDGFNVWTAVGSGGIDATTRGGATKSQYTSTAIDSAAVLGYVKGRLMLATTNSLYDVTASGALPTVLFTHPNTDFRWVGFAEAGSAIYAAGFSGDKSLIYRTTVKPTGASLEVPVVAGILPDGEIVRSLEGYGDLLFIGTDQGVRLAVLDQAGNANVGALLNLGVSVRCFEPQGRFVWFGWTNFSATKTGLGRLDPTILNPPAEVPAYASDLLAVAQGIVTSVVTVSGRRYFTVSGNGLWGETATKVASGTFDSGLVTYGVPDRKVSMQVDVRFEPLPAGASIVTAFNSDSSAFTTVGTAATADRLSAVWPVSQFAGETMEIRQTLNRATDTTVGPELTRHTLRSWIAGRAGEILTLPIKLFETVVTLDDDVANYVPNDEIDFFNQLREDGTLVTVQLYDRTFAAFVSDYQFLPENRTANGQEQNGVLTVIFTVPSQE